MLTVKSLQISDVRKFNAALKRLTELGEQLNGHTPVRRKRRKKAVAEAKPAPKSAPQPKRKRSIAQVQEEA